MNDNKNLIGSVIVLAGLILIAGCLILTSHPQVSPAGAGPITISVDGKPVSVNVDGKPIVVSSGQTDGTQPTDQTFGANAGEVSVWTSGQFTDDLLVNDTLTIQGNTAMTNLAATTITVGTSGWPIDFVGHATTTIDVDSLSAGAATSVNLNLSGISAGDSVRVGLLGSWAAPSSSVVVTGSVTSTNQYILYFQNTSSSAVNLTSAKYDVWVTSGN